MKLRDLAGSLGCELRGDGAIEITGVAGMEQAAADQLTFLANPKYTHKIKQTRAGAVLVTKITEGIEPAQLVSANPYFDFARALELFDSFYGVYRGVGTDRRRRFDWALRGGR
jgi:UDP-3-O-[3-hydroxymyristoyl] glucosamine N-acyltransferase